MNLDWNKIEKAWKKFASNHSMALQDSDQQLINNKRKIYYSIEKQGEIEIYYRCVFYMLDTINAGNDFRIALPIEMKTKVQISRTGLLTRLIAKKQIKIKSTNTFDLDDKLKASIIDAFRDFSDLKINQGFTAIAPMSIDKKKCVLEMHTKHLPTDINGLEKLRELILILYSDFNKQTT